MEEPGSGGTGDLSSAGKEGRGKEEGRKGLPIGTYAGRDWGGLAMMLKARLT